MNGPNFLTDNNFMEQTSTCIPIVPAQEVLMISKESEFIESSLLHRIIGYYSSLQRLLKIVARLLRFMYSVKGKKEEITVSHMKQALRAMIRYSQKSMDITNLKRLHPFTDDLGLLRVTTRFSKVTHLSFDQKFPIVLPKGFHLTNLIIQDEHTKCAHMGQDQRGIS